MADWFAGVNGTGAPDNPFDPSDLRTAVAIAQDDDTIFCRLSNAGATVTFQEDLVGDSEIDVNITLDTYITGSPPDFTTGIPGIVAIDGDVTITDDITLTLVGNLELRLVGQPGTLSLRDGAAINGDGMFACTATGGDHQIRLGDPIANPPFSPNTGTIRNLRVDKANGDVNVIDENPSNGGSNLRIANRLDVDAGELNMRDVNLRIISNANPPSGPSPRVNIDGGAVISGSRRFFIAVEAAARGGFPNTSGGAFRITGDGNINMRFEKTTDAGVVIELDEVGAGGTSVNRAGALYVMDARTLNGSFRNAFAARTELPALETITANLEVEGPGDEVFGGDGRCESGFENGVYINPNVDIQGQVILVNTDDPNLPCGIQGLSCFQFPPSPPIGP